MSESHTIVRQSGSVFCATVGDEAVLYDDQGGTYFGLNPVARRVWEMAGQQGQTIAAIREGLTREFDVEPERASTDLATLLSNMAERGLVVLEPVATLSGQ